MAEDRESIAPEGVFIPAFLIVLALALTGLLTVVLGGWIPEGRIVHTMRAVIAVATIGAGALGYAARLAAHDIINKKSNLGRNLQQAAWGIFGIVLAHVIPMRLDLARLITAAGFWVFILAVPKLLAHAALRLQQRQVREPESAIS